jgi:putative ABC transport system substrate-binding protein
MSGRSPEDSTHLVAAFLEGLRQTGFVEGESVAIGGLILIPGPIIGAQRELLISLATQHRLPSIYAFRYHPAAGGLASYGVDLVDLYRRRAASYVDRILKGEKPADLPVQAPTKFELVINFKTAKALGLELPPTLLARADELIE